MEKKPLKTILISIFWESLPFLLVLALFVATDALRPWLLYRIPTEFYSFISDSFLDYRLGHLYLGGVYMAYILFGVRWSYRTVKKYGVFALLGVLFFWLVTAPVFSTFYLLGGMAVFGK